MSLSSTTLSAIQQAGTAAFAADAELKNVVKDYAGRVTAAMGVNPFGLGNDALFENWKRVARLSQTLSAIEEELKKVYQMAADLTLDEGPAVHNLSPLDTSAAQAETVQAGPVSQPDTAPVDVVVKSGKKKSKPAARNAKAAAQPKAAPAAAPIGNPAKLLRHLERVLNASEFTVINQAASGLATGIPAGSVNAAVKKLIASGRIVAGPAGSFKLVK